MSQFCDVSNYQKVIDWPAYKKWSASFDGVSRVAIKSSEGEGYTDPSFAAHRAGALAAGIDEIWYYHFGRPGLGNLAIDEANSQQHIIGAIRAQDVICLDMEEAMPQANAAWALAWLAQQQHNYGKPPLLYSYPSYIQARLQDPRLANYPLWLAAFSYDPTKRPACPKPWTSYAAIQYTDRAQNVPGIASVVDANILLDASNFSGGVPVPATTSGGENATFIDNITQLEPSETQDACVAFSAANVFYSTAPGTPNHHSSEDVDKLADTWYQRFTGSLQSSSGLSVEQLHTMLTALGLSFEALPITGNGAANDEAVRAALRAGKIVIVCAAESSFYDLIIKRAPYSWDTSRFNHCIVVSGLITSGPYAGNVWVRDTVAVSGGYPPSTKRPYDLGKMQYVSLTAVTPSWLKGKKTMDITDKALQAYYKVVNGTLVHDAFAIHGAILTHYLSTGGLAELGLPTSNEIVLDAVKYPGAVYQRFERGVVYYDPKHLADDPPGTSGQECYRGHIDVGAGVDPRIADLQKQIDALKVGGVQAITSVAQEALKGLQAIEAALVAALPTKG